MLRKLKKVFKSKSKSAQPIVSAKSCGFNSKAVCKNAYSVVFKLQKAGFEAYIVGGGVRDILLGQKPKDFDVVTSARPEQVRRLFRHSRIIGRRFKIVHVMFGRRNMIEVSTYRGKAELADQDHEEGTVIVQNENIYGDIQQDALRRDFRMNALYYDPIKHQIIDYTGGLADIQSKRVTTIGDPNKRFHEDPVRMLRAIRLAYKLNFDIEAETKQNIESFQELLYQVPQARLFDEWQKFFFTGYAEKSLQGFAAFQLTQLFFPKLTKALNSPKAKQYHALIEQAAKSTDNRLHNGMSINPGFYLSVCGWPILQEHMYHLCKRKKMRFSGALHQALDFTLTDLNETLAIPKRFLSMAHSIWLLQYQLEKKRGKQAFRIVNERYYRAAIDLLEMRSLLGEPYQDLCQWWRQFEKANEDQRAEMVAELEPKR